jgi:hypothetical protein
MPLPYTGTKLMAYTRFIQHIDNDIRIPLEKNGRNIHNNNNNFKSEVMMSLYDSINYQTQDRSDVVVDFSILGTWSMQLLHLHLHSVLH